MWIIVPVQKLSGWRKATPHDDLETVTGPGMLVPEGMVAEYKQLYAVGHYRPTGSDRDGQAEPPFIELCRVDSLTLAKREVHYLNGGER